MLKCPNPRHEWKVFGGSLREGDSRGVDGTVCYFGDV